MILTSLSVTTNLSLLQYCSTRLASRKPAQAAINAVFFCAKFFSSSFYVELDGTLARVAGRFTGTPISSSLGSMIGVMSSGLSLLNRVKMMNTNLQQANSAKNTANISSQSIPKNYQALFTLLIRTPTENRVICQNLNFDQATGLAKEIPSAIVKFSRMVV